MTPVASAGCVIAMETNWMTSPLSSTFVIQHPSRVEPCWEWKWKALSCTCKLNSHYPLAPRCSLRPFGYLFIWHKQDGAFGVVCPCSHSVTKFYWLWIAWNPDFTNSPQWMIYCFHASKLGDSNSSWSGLLFFPAVLCPLTTTGYLYITATLPLSLNHPPTPLFVPSAT